MIFFLPGFSGYYNGGPGTYSSRTYDTPSRIYDRPDYHPPRYAVMADKPTINLATAEGTNRDPAALIFKLLQRNQPLTISSTDVPEILAMIHELAAYEGEPPSSIVATKKSLLQTLTFAPSDSSKHKEFSGSGYAKTLIIRAPAGPSEPSAARGAVAGMAMFFYNYSTWRSAPGVYLEDLFVRPQFRQRGYATLMIKQLAREVKRINGGRLEWKCLVANEASLRFYRNLGAVEQKEWVGLRVDGEALEKLAA